MLEHTIPIHIVHGDGAPVAHGTGVLARIGNSSFLLSCEHVLSKAQEKGAVLYVPGADGELLVHLADAGYDWTTDKNVDLGYALLNERIVSLLRPDKRFLGLADLELRGQEPQPLDLYAVTGYPVVSTKPDHAISNINSTPLSFTTSAFEGVLEGHVDGVTIALSFDPRETGDVDGNHARMPDLHGVSGCGIWKLGSLAASTSPNWSPKNVRLIGLEHGFLPGAIKGSHIAALLDMISETCPALRPEIDRHR